ncbi:MAG TPA: hypothetical protein VFC15_13515 [Candidatus Limnocylindrales bacterium]|nr:hypothetical protein [Candidatus Limnocylindrales bacterium]
MMLAVAIGQAQQETSVTPTVAGLSIPAELTTTVRAENAHRGDSVEFRTLEAVLIANGLVIPKNAKLLGRIVGAASREGDKPSWLVLLVERAEWKQQTVPLHAFIARQIAITGASQNNYESADSMTPSTVTRRPARENIRSAVEVGADISPMTKLPQDSRTSSRPDPNPNTLMLKDVRIVRDKDGIAYLFSSKANVTLPSGTLFVLQNQAATGVANSGAGDPKAAAPVSPQ